MMQEKWNVRVLVSDIN